MAGLRSLWNALTMSPAEKQAMLSKKRKAAAAKPKPQPKAAPKKASSSLGAHRNRRSRIDEAIRRSGG